jgi:adenylate kinase family enzyme
MIWFILGPSGVGKSDFGKYLAVKHKWLHLEIDRFPNGDGIDIHGLRQEWDQFYQRKDPRAIVAELTKRLLAEGKNDCALTFPSGVVLSDEHMRSTNEQIKIIYLYGSAAHCISAFLNRERQSKRNLGVDHWITNNCASYFLMSTPVFNPNRVHVFSHSGTRRTHDVVFAELSKTNGV